MSGIMEFKFKCNRPINERNYDCDAPCVLWVPPGISKDGKAGFGICGNFKVVEK